MLWLAAVHIATTWRILPSPCQTAFRDPRRAIAPGHFHRWAFTSHDSFILDSFGSPKRLDAYLCTAAQPPPTAFPNGDAFFFFFFFPFCFSSDGDQLTLHSFSLHFRSDHVRSPSRDSKKSGRGCPLPDLGHLGVCWPVEWVWYIRYIASIPLYTVNGHRIQSILSCICVFLSCIFLILSVHNER